MTEFKLVFSAFNGKFLDALKKKYEPIAKAGTAALTDAANIVKAEGRADIGNAGFSIGWQNAFRVDVHPKPPKVSANAAAFVFHKIHYADVFESGAHIQGRPLLWARLSNTPKLLPNRIRFTAKNYRQFIGPLVYIRRGGKKPLLAAPLKVSKANAKKKQLDITVPFLKRGVKGRGSVSRLVPLFVGLSAITIRRRFHIGKIVAAAKDRLAGLFTRHLRDE